MSKGMLIVISGPSGSGKGTVVKQLRQNGGYTVSVSVTTRPPRPGEDGGVDYFFVSDEEFRRMRSAGDLLESAWFVDHYYGTPRAYVEAEINKGKVVVLEIDVNGAFQIKARIPGAVLVFLLPPDMAELRRRLTNRATEAAGNIEGRLRRAAEEIEMIEKYDYLVINDTVENAAEAINTIVAAESLRPGRSADIISGFRGGE